MHYIERRDYMRNDGFILAADVAYQLIETARCEIEPKPLDKTEPGLFDHAASPSGAALFHVAEELSRQLGEFTEDFDEFADKYHVTDEDKNDTKNRFTFMHGLGDQNFTWHFAPAVANAVVETFEADGLITNERRAELTLGDWSTLLRADWFGKIVHDFALTRNGIYQDFGSRIDAYEMNAFLYHLRPQGNRLFNTRLHYDQENNLAYPEATLTTAIRNQLRDYMKADRSPGCPVARKAGTLPSELIRTDPHAQSLIAAGRFAITNTESDRARFSQEKTPIDASLGVLAEKLYEYDLRYGTPTWQTQSGIVVHELRPTAGFSVVV